MKNWVSKIVLVMCLVLIGVAASAGEKPSFDLDWYGYIKADASHDQNLTSHGNFAIWVKPQGADDDAQFNMTASETRFGLKLDGKGYEKVEVTGKVEFDLYGAVGGGSVAENKAMLQLRHAYFSVKSGKFMMIAGQSWDLISPLNPSTLNYPVLWGVGNTQYRRPQVSLWYTMPAGNSTNVTVAGGFFRTIGDDLSSTTFSLADEAADGTDDGTDAAIPSLQGRLDITTKSSSGSSLRFGVSGLWGQLKAESNMGNSEDYDSWGVFGHVDFSSGKRFGVKGEVFSGSNLGSYFGGILNKSTIDGVGAKGGWGYAWAMASPKVKVGAGAGVDDPDDADLIYASVDDSKIRGKNRCIFGNVRYTIVPQVTIGAEVSHWETTYRSGDSADNLRLQSSFILSF